MIAANATDCTEWFQAIVSAHKEWRRAVLERKKTSGDSSQHKGHTGPTGAKRTHSLPLGSNAKPHGPAPSSPPLADLIDLRISDEKPDRFSISEAEAKFAANTSLSSLRPELTQLSQESFLPPLEQRFPGMATVDSLHHPPPPVGGLGSYPISTSGSSNTLYHVFSSPELSVPGVHPYPATSMGSLPPDASSYLRPHAHDYNSLHNTSPYPREVFASNYAHYHYPGDLPMSPPTTYSPLPAGPPAVVPRVAPQPQFQQYPNGAPYTPTGPFTNNSTSFTTNNTTSSSYPHVPNAY